MKAAPSPSAAICTPASILFPKNMSGLKSGIHKDFIHKLSDILCGKLEKEHLVFQQIQIQPWIGVPCLPGLIFQDMAFGKRQKQFVIEQCGVGSMLTVAQDRLLAIAQQYEKNVSIHLFGQEVNPETYAICKADMLLKGDGDQAEHISYGSTLSLDGNATRQFDFMLSNPPYGKSRKVDAEKMGGKKEILDTCFNVYLEGGEQMAMIPRTSDGQLLFLLNNVAKMKKDTPLSD